MWFKQAVLVLAILIGLPVWIAGAILFVLAARVFMWVDQG
jgi:hypothetical protein